MASGMAGDFCWLLHICVILGRGARELCSGFGGSVREMRGTFGKSSKCSGRAEGVRVLKKMSGSGEGKMAKRRSVTSISRLGIGLCLTKIGKCATMEGIGVERDRFGLACLGVNRRLDGGAGWMVVLKMAVRRRGGDT